jgi:hypothetical protein
MTFELPSQALSSARKLPDFSAAVIPSAVIAVILAR